MTIAVPDAERRNLVLTSLSFILFYLADGSVVGDTLRIQVVNISFGKPEVLGCFAWIMLAWFLFRFWQKFQRKVRETCTSAIDMNRGRPIVKKYCISKLKGQYSEIKVAVVASADFDSGTSTYKYQLEIHEGVTNEAEPKSFTRPQGRTHFIDLKGASGFFVKYWCFFRATIYDNGFVDYLFPYVLFAVAFSLGILNNEFLKDCIELLVL